MSSIPIHSSRLDHCHHLHHQQQQQQQQQQEPLPPISPSDSVLDPIYSRVPAAWTDYTAFVLNKAFPPAVPIPVPLSVPVSPSTPIVSNHHHHHHHNVDITMMNLDDEQGSLPPLPTFLRRLVDLTATPLSTYVLAHMYLMRVVDALAAVTTSNCTTHNRQDAAHRLFVAALLVATKVSQDPPNLSSGNCIPCSSSPCSSSPGSSSSCCSCSDFQRPSSCPTSASGPAPLAWSAASPAALAAISGGTYSSRDVFAMERSLCKALRHRLWVPAPRLAHYLANLCTMHPELGAAGGYQLLSLFQDGGSFSLLDPT